MMNLPKKRRHIGCELWLLVAVCIACINLSAASPRTTTDIHGEVKMGVKSHTCDDGMTNLEQDWDNSTNFEYVCQPDEKAYHPQKIEALEECLASKDIPRPMHRCMSDRIMYDDAPPRGGSHRPLWPIFGEYVYLPPQRWVHALEHGAAVFLFHPCANPMEINKLKNLARRCLRKHVITPYRELDPLQPLAIVTYGCRLLMGTYDDEVAENFVKVHAMTAPESMVPRDGQFGWGLIRKAANVSDYMDSELCPVQKQISTASPRTTTDIHGGVKMGVKSHTCDDGMTNLEQDWDNSTNFEYICQPDEKAYRPQKIEPLEECLASTDIPRPMHRCMSDRIMYDDVPPRGGSHRPLWPIFGEYVYLPPQRWVHALEHGAAVFLFHPCANLVQINKLKNLARRCLRKHVITPYRELDPLQPLAIVTYGCRLLMGTYDDEVAENFVKVHAMTAPESMVPRDGQFGWGLIRKAANVSDYMDSELCPVQKQIRFPDKLAMIAENMENQIEGYRP